MWRKKKQKVPPSAYRVIARRPSINHEVDSYGLTLARSTNHEPDRCCLRLGRLVQSTYRDVHPWCVVLTCMFGPIPLTEVLNVIAGEGVNFQFQFLISVFNFDFYLNFFINFQLRFLNLFFIFNYDFQFRFSVSTLIFNFEF